MCLHIHFGSSWGDTEFFRRRKSTMTWVRKSSRKLLTSHVGRRFCPLPFLRSTNNPLFWRTQGKDNILHKKSATGSFRAEAARVTTLKNVLFASLQKSEYFSRYWSNQDCKCVYFEASSSLTLTSSSESGSGEKPRKWIPKMVCFQSIRRICRRRDERGLWGRELCDRQ